MLLLNRAAMPVELPAIGFILSIDAAIVSLAFHFCIYFLIIMNLYSIAKLWGWFRNLKITSAVAVGSILWVNLIFNVRD